MDKDDFEHLQETVKSLQIEVAKTKAVVGTLTLWLAKEIGEEGVEKLLKDLGALGT